MSAPSRVRVTSPETSPVLMTMRPLSSFPVTVYSPGAEMVTVLPLMETPPPAYLALSPFKVIASSEPPAPVLPSLDAPMTVSAQALKQERARMAERMQTRIFFIAFSFFRQIASLSDSLPQMMFRFPLRQRISSINCLLTSGVFRLMV